MGNKFNKHTELNIKSIIVINKPKRNLYTNKTRTIFNLYFYNEKEATPKKKT